MTTNHTLRKAIRSNFDLSQIARDALLKNLEVAGLDYHDSAGDRYTIALTSTGIAVTGSFAGYGHNDRNFTKQYHHTWDELDQRADYTLNPRAMKLKTGKVFHPIRNIAPDGKSFNTYCGEGYEQPERYVIELVKQFTRSGNTACKNCARNQKRSKK